MRYNRLGRSGLFVSEVVLGTMTFGDDPDRPIACVPLERARELVARAIDAGVNLLDTADVYAGGRSEEIVGEVLRGRDDILVATKARFRMGDGSNDEGLTRHHLIRACEASLRRLRRDHIDLYYLHAWDGQTPLDETLGALEHLLQQGKIRYTACSNFAGWQLEKTIGVAQARGWRPLVSHQVCYSLLSRDAEAELIPSAIDADLGVFVWGPLAGGLLSGKYRRGVEGPEGARHSDPWREPLIPDWDRAYDIIETVVQIAADRGISASQVALAWILGRTGVTSVVIGARKPEQLIDNLGATDVQLSADERARLDAVSLPALTYPHWHQRNTAHVRLGDAERSLIGQYL
ncbi:aldo/keto reductase [Streptomyces chartreusis]|uniref:aldo/keto reductase n=1 Tax=Streptomyces chartreusis TaxID=1969 RepID=UPI0033F4BA46